MLKNCVPAILFDGFEPWRGALCASSQFAALLALDAKRYAVEYAGLVAGNERAEYPVYKIGLK